VKTAQLAINSVTLRKATFEQLLPAVARAGFKQVEFHLPLIKDWMAKGHSVREVQALLAEYGLRCVGGFETTVQAYGETGARQQNHALHCANAELLAELGGGVMVAGTDGPPAGEKPDLRTLETIGGTARELAERFPANVSLAIEFNWSPVVKSLRAAALMAQAAAHPRVGILFDPAHYHCTSSKFEDLTPATVAKILHVHVDDMRDKPGELSNCNDDRVLPGQGTLDLRTIFGRLEQHGYQGLYAIEMFNKELWETPFEAAAQQSYNALLTLARR